MIWFLNAFQGTPDKARSRSRPSSLIVIPPTESPAHVQKTGSREGERLDDNVRLPPQPPPITSKPKSECFNIYYVRLTVLLIFINIHACSTHTDTYAYPLVSPFMLSVSYAMVHHIIWMALGLHVMCANCH